MGSDGFVERFNQHLDTGEYSKEFVSFLGRACRVGRVSYETALDFVQEVDTEIARAVGDRVFGAVPRPEVFSDDPRLFDVDL